MDLLNRTAIAPDRIPVFRPDLETATGGFKLDTTGLVVGDVLPAGAPIVFDEINRTAKFIKTATVYSAVSNGATAIPVAKGHLFKVGDFVGKALNGKAVTITSIVTTNALYDTINVDSTLDAIAAGAGVFQAVAAQASTGSAEYATVTEYTSGLLKTDTRVDTRNTFVDVVVKCTVYARRIPILIDGLKAKLPKTILFSNSK